MDITITTSDPTSINTQEIEAALENLGYFVASITIIDRGE